MLRKASISTEALANVLTQSSDCVKLIDEHGALIWMNPNGLCSMEIDDFSSIEGQPWASLWPESARPQIESAYTSARSALPQRFQAHCPTAKGNDRWWDVSVTALSASDGSFSGYLSISRDITDSELARQALSIAASEMRHRLRNSYAIISSLLHSHARGTPDLEAFSHEMVDRISALGSAQTLFHDGQASCELAALIPALVDPFRRKETDVRLDIDAPTPVGQSAADAIALVIGELSVNSTKHGAFAHGGHIHITAQTGEDIAIRWDEDSARAVSSHERQGGQGLRLIERITKARRGTFELEWKQNGLSAHLTLPF
ncbi:PAS domain-containing protein [Sphingobium sp. DEHP117]|uniref:sensor histidine kinase n=1 Tax=Sphingobium sp. DEHP117 TaxID=2993436 RepID=UPI0027D7102F|nr:PAS domain-containing protein [Sphingobium sp. DEHP117]MDQ4419807.1 PAS domain-containing protein [Sphingobium sp. DEHP117]